MKNEFSNAKSASAQTSTCRKTHGVSKLLFAILLSVVLFGGAMFLLFANNSAPVSTALAANSLSTLPTTLDTAPTFIYNSSAGTVTGTDQAINGYNFKDDVYSATISTDATLGSATEGRIVTLTKYTPTTPTQVVVPSQMVIDGNTYQVVIKSEIPNSAYPYFKNNDVVTNISLAKIGEVKVLATNCQSLFAKCLNITSLDIGNLDTSNLTDMCAMFATGVKNSNTNEYESALGSIFFGPNFNTSKVTNMGCMFSNCSSLTSLDLGNFDTSNVAYMFDMFSNCSSLTSLDISNFDTSNVTRMGSMFSNCSSLTSLDLSNFNTSKVTDMNSMFDNCSGLTSLELSNFNTSKVTNMGGMFSNCSSLTSLDVSNFNTSKVTYMGSMFSGCSSLTSLDLSNFNTSKVTYMGSMFSNCSSLTTLNLSSFDTSNVTNMSEMFRCCSSLTSLDLSNFDTRNVTYMESMFDGCSSLTSLDLSSFNTSNVTDMSGMFAGTKVNTLNLSSFVFKSDCNVENMFGMPPKSDNELAGMATGLCGELGLDPVADADKISEIPFSCFTEGDEYNTKQNKRQYFSDLLDVGFTAMVEAGAISESEADANKSSFMSAIELYLGTSAQIQSIILPASVNGLSIALPASEYAVNGTGEYAYTTLQGYEDLNNKNGTSYIAGATLENKNYVSAEPETPTEPTSTGVATSLLLAVSGAVVVALFAVAIAHVGKKKKVVRK